MACSVIACIVVAYLIFTSYYKTQNADLRNKLNAQKDECRKNHVNK